jgi:hypothetical protein
MQQHTRTARLRPFGDHLGLFLRKHLKTP